MINIFVTIGVMRVPDIASAAVHAGNDITAITENIRHNTLHQQQKYGHIGTGETREYKNESSPDQLEFISIDDFVQKALSSSSYRTTTTTTENTIDGKLDNYHLNKTECDKNLEFMNTDAGYYDHETYRRDSLNDYYCNNTTTAKSPNSTDILNENNGDVAYYRRDSLNSEEELASSDNNVNDSAVSTNDSLPSSSSYCAYFPRGIINPNYPGFQHLAHTLTEHFDNSMFFDSGESSEVSEYEMDVSVDSCDENSEPNNNAMDSNILPEEFTDVEQDNDKLNENDNENDNDNEYANKMATSLSLAYQDYDKNRLDLTNIPKFPAKDMNCRTQSQSATNNMTPDILIENNFAQIEICAKHENRPDLLREVSPQYEGKSYVGAVRRSRSKHDMQIGLTPDIDIIGDFGEEVEREFGLLVSGYRKLHSTNEDDGEQHKEDVYNKVNDALLSRASDQIDSTKYLANLNKLSQDEEDADDDDDDDDHKQYKTAPNDAPTTPNADESQILTCWPQSESDAKTPATPSPDLNENSLRPNDNQPKAPKYQKSSYDDRQLPPVAIEYKRCQQQSVRATRKPQCPMEKSARSTKVHKTNLMHRFLNKKGGSLSSGGGCKSHRNRKPEEEELYQYQQLMSDKELILRNSKYTKLSSWAQYVKNSVKDRGFEKTTELISPSALDLFDAYKIGAEIDMETLQKNFKMAKEIEKKRRNDREEIHRRLAMDTEDNAKYVKTKEHFKHIHSQICADVYSDTESHSSDSETCPKLSNKMKHNNKFDLIGMPLTHKPTKEPANAQKVEDDVAANHEEDRECDFFTQQARFQIEARMALAQAKTMAQMQMEIERQKQRISPITVVIRDSLEKVGVRLTPDKRRVSRLMLTEMNIAQLQILVNSLHNHIEDLNEVLMQFLIERDDLHMRQDVMLSEVEELTRYIGAQETISTQNRKEQLPHKRIV